jgi:hypothetical protein
MLVMSGAIIPIMFIIGIPPIMFIMDMHPIPGWA